MATANTAHKQDNGYTPAPANAVIDDKVVKKLIGEAVASVDGVLDMKGGLGDFLKAEDCDEGQGYLYSKPIPGEEFEKLLKCNFEESG